MFTYIYFCIYFLVIMVEERKGEKRLGRLAALFGSSLWLEKRRGGSYLADWPHYYAPPFLSFGLWVRFQLCLCFLVIWSQVANLTSSGVGAAAWSASGPAAGIPVVVGDMGPGGDAGRGGGLWHRGEVGASCTWRGGCVRWGGCGSIGICVGGSPGAGLPLAGLFFI